MIRIDRGPEPELLSLSRDEQLARARLRGTSPPEIHGYAGARDVLAERQSYKCAYCELTLRHEAAPVEHYRPKSRADDVDWSGLTTRNNPRQTDLEDDRRFARGLPPSRDGFARVRWTSRPGYWWLAWTWENLVFGCGGCNSGVKNSRFPQARNARTLNEHESPPGEEEALLLDPTDAVEDPIDHIHFRKVHNRWIPTPRGGSPRGAWTIALLRLDSSPALLTAYARRVKELERRSRRFSTSSTASASVIEPQWLELCRDLFAPNEELLGLTYDWLDAQYPPKWRADHGVSLDRPILRMAERGSGHQPRPAVAVLEGLDGLPSRLCDLIRVARNYRAPGGKHRQSSVEYESLPVLVAKILEHRPDATNEEIGALLRRAPSTIRNSRRSRG